MRRALTRLGLVLAVVMGLPCSRAAAEPQGKDARRTVVIREGSLRARAGVPMALRLLQSEDLPTRLRGLERLGLIGGDEAIDALVEAVEQNSPAMRDPRMRLTAVRALAAETNRDNVRQFLLREMTDASAGASPLLPIIRSTAALVLAHGGDKKSLAALAAAIVQNGTVAELASHALRAYPPASLEAFLEAQKRLVPPLISFLGDLGDLRAIGRLRPLLSDSDEAVQISAAVALAKLGDDSSLAASRAWLGKPEGKARRAAVEVATHLGVPLPAGFVRGLLDTPAGNLAAWEEGLRLALLAPSADLSSSLGRLVPLLPDSDRAQAIHAAGRAGGPSTILPLLEQAGTSLAAAHAIALLPGEAARDALEAGLVSAKTKNPDLFRLLVRASIVRALRLDAPRNLTATLRSLLASADPTEASIAIFGLVATGALDADDAIGLACGRGNATPVVCNPAKLAAVGRAALALPPSSGALDALFQVLVPAAAHAAAETAIPHSPETATIVAGIALLAHPNGGPIATKVLAAWAEGGGPLAPLSARALPTRDDPTLRGRIKRLLEGVDPVLRAHTALGLAQDPEPSAVSLLTKAYPFEDDPTVRRAILRALARRTEPQRLGVLTLASSFDPDDESRALARAALLGTLSGPGRPLAFGVEPRPQVAWVVINDNDAAAKPRPRSLWLARSDGIAVPLAADPDGVLLVPGLPPSNVSIELPRVPDQDSEPPSPVAAPALAAGARPGDATAR